MFYCFDYYLLLLLLLLLLLRQEAREVFRENT